VSTAAYAVAETFCLAPTVLLSGAAYVKAFSPEQVNALMMIAGVGFAAKTATLVDVAEWEARVAGVRAG
jgi:hypothetical protein